MRVPGFTVGWGYSTETSLHVIRLMTGGVFDRYPKLRMVIGHMGEALPFSIDRLDNRYQWEFNFSGKARPMKRLPSEYLRDHFHITTSGMNYWPQLKMTIDVMGIDKVMFAVDYPQEEHRPAVETIDNAPAFQGRPREILLSQRRTGFRDQSLSILEHKEKAE